MFELICPDCDISEFMFYDEFQPGWKFPVCGGMYEYFEWDGE